MGLKVERSEELAVETGADIVKMRRRCGEVAREAGFRATDQTRFMTAASELARNALVHGGGGHAVVEHVRRTEDGRAGLRLTVEDTGPGIDDVDRAFEDGYTSGKGLGLGLGGARRLADDLRIETGPGRGTRVVLTKWLR